MCIKLAVVHICHLLPCIPYCFISYILNTYSIKDLVLGVVWDTKMNIVQTSRAFSPHLIRERRTVFRCLWKKGDAESFIQGTEVYWGTLTRKWSLLAKIHDEIHPSTHSPTCLPTHPPIHPSIHPFSHPSLLPPIHLAIHPPSHPSIQQIYIQSIFYILGFVEQVARKLDSMSRKVLIGHSGTVKECLSGRAYCLSKGIKKENVGRAWE